MNSSFVQLMMSSGTSTEFKDFLETQKIITIVDFARAAVTEEKVETDIIQPAIAKGVKFELIIDKSNVRKLWAACRASLNSEASDEAQSSVSHDAPLRPEQALDVNNAWIKKHSFILPESWVLVPGLVGKLWRGVHKDSPILEVILAEKIRQLSNGDKPMAGRLDLIPGRAMEPKEVILDAVYRPLDLYGRLRAYFMTLAYVSIHKESFFDLQTAIYMSEKILTLVTQQFKKQTAPTSFYVEARASTAHHFAEQIRVAK